MNQPITVEITIVAPMSQVWQCWNTPEHIQGWAFASDDWEAKALGNDLRVGGKFTTIMSAKDKSASFEFTGTYSNVKECETLEYDMADGRHVNITFRARPEGVTITETFDPEKENAEEKQRSGWQAILDNFKKHVEGHA